MRWKALTLAWACWIPYVCVAQAVDPTPAGGAVQAVSRVSETTVTLQQAIDRALAHNPELSVSAREVQASDAARLQAGASPNPQLAALVEDTRRQTRNTTLQVNQPIELGGKRAARIEVAERARDVALVQQEARRSAVRATVTAAFFDVLLAQERVRLSEASVLLAQSGTQATAKRVLAGKASPVEETKARVAEASVRIERTQAASELAAARQRLAASWGESVPRFERVEAAAETLPNVPGSREVQARLVDSPMLRQAQLELRRRQALVEVERARRVPDLTVSLGVRRNQELGLNQAIIGVSMPLPLFDTNRGNIQEAIARQEQARDELSVAELRLGSEAAQSRERLASANAQAEALRAEVLPGAQSAYDAAIKGFELGKFSFLEALDAQRTLIDAKAQYLRALASAHAARIELDRILGSGSDMSSARTLP